MSERARVFPDGRAAWIYPLTFGRARLGVGDPRSGSMDDVW